jgi:hypothetical protein
MAQHAQHLADLTTARPEPRVPSAEPFRTDLGADRLRPGLYRLTLRPDDGGATLHGTCASPSTAACWSPPATCSRRR